MGTAEFDLPQAVWLGVATARHEAPPLPQLLSRVPRECPYSLDQIVGSGDEDWFPEPR
jgi:hypothetical protein